MKRIFQRWTLVLMMLSPAMVGATPILDFSSGFAGSTSTLNFNGSAQISGTRARITNGGVLQVGSVWSRNQVDIRKFSCQFTFQITSPTEAGFTFAIQRAGNTATAYPYEFLGFTPMSPSFAVKFDIYGAVPPNSVSTTGIYSNGAYPNDDPPASIDMAPSGIDLHSGHIFRVLLVYDGVTLQQTVTDTSTNASFTHNYTIDIATTISGVDAYVGFTGSTGGFTSTQEILTWTYSVTPSPFDVDFTAFPERLQVFPRNRTTNNASVPVAGSELMGGFSQAVLRVYRNGAQIGGDQVQTLTYSNGRAPFSFTPTIVAELAHYDVELLLRDGLNQLSSVARAQDIVAGDVIVIQGQSNALAKTIAGSASTYISPFIRTVGIESDWPPAGPSAASWMVATGDGTLGQDDLGDAGQWGLVMANQIMTANNIPVAIINAAFGGQMISFFQRNDALHDDISTNYGRLLRRLQRAGVAGSIRTILFYQGESDRNAAATHQAGFTALRSDWLQDYPSIERLYVFQVRETASTGPCAGDVARFNVDLRNRQRLFADQFTNLSVMSTTGLDGHEGCHFYFTNGYQNIGFNIARVLQRDLYGGPSLPNTNPPNPAYAVLTGASHNLIRIPLRNRTDAITFNAGAKADFAIVGSAVSILSGTVANGVIELTLSGNGTGASSVVYTGHSGIASGNWVANSNGIGLLSFIEPILTDTTPPVITLVGPNPVIINVGGTYVDPGATATDNLDGNLTSSIVVNASAVNTAVPGDYPVTYNVSDVAGNAATQVTRTVHVHANGAPTANPQSVTTNEDTARAITLTASDPDNDPLTFSVVTGPMHGSLSGTAPNLTYTPTANYNGADSFTFKANDGQVDSNTATVSITVTPVNDPPTADAQSVATNEGTQLNITLTGSDVETPPANLTFTVTVPPAHGALTGTAPTLTYTPAANYSGSDNFNFTVTDTGDGASPPLTSSEATISIIVNGLPEIAVEQPVGNNLTDGASTVDFGSVARNANNSRTFTVRNTGGADLTGLAITFDGTYAEEFTVTGPPTAPVVPGGSTTFTVKFTPTALGVRTAALHIASNDADENPFDIALTGTGITNLEAWRIQYFGSPDNSGDGADTNDFDFDGLPNLMEFATDTDPTQGNAGPGDLVLADDTMEFLYTRTKAAINDGIIFRVEWSDDLSSPNWNTTGVTEVVMSEDNTVQHVRDSVSSGSGPRRFMRLNVIRP